MYCQVMVSKIYSSPCRPFLCSVVVDLSGACAWSLFCDTVKPISSGHSKRRPKLVFTTCYRLMQVLQNAPREHSAILSTFIKLQFLFKIFVLSIFEWPLKTGFTVHFYLLVVSSVGQ